MCADLCAPCRSMRAVPMCADLCAPVCRCMRAVPISSLPSSLPGAPGSSPKAARIASTRASVQSIICLLKFKVCKRTTTSRGLEIAFLRFSYGCYLLRCSRGRKRRPPQNRFLCIVSLFWLWPLRSYSVRKRRGALPCQHQAGAVRGAGPMCPAVPITARAPVPIRGTKWAWPCVLDARLLFGDAQTRRNCHGLCGDFGGGSACDGVVGVKSCGERALSRIVARMMPTTLGPK